MKIKLVIFDLDDTLAESKCDLAPEMVAALEGLLETRHVAVVSGCKEAQFHKQFVHFVAERYYPRLVVAPVSGGQLLRYREGAWRTVAETSMGISLEAVVAAFERAFDEVGFERPTQLWGEQFEDRVCQVTFSALGQAAPHGVKKGWDPDFARRKPVIAALRRLLPEGLMVRAGGSTSIDVSAFEKDYGINAIVREVAAEGIDADAALFVGDAIFPEGNDYSVTRTSVRYLMTRSVADTRAIIAQILADEDAVLARAGRGAADASPRAPTLD